MEYKQKQVFAKLSASCGYIESLISFKEIWSRNVLVTTCNRQIREESVGLKRESFATENPERFEKRSRT